MSFILSRVQIESLTRINEFDIVSRVLRKEQEYISMPLLIWHTNIIEEIREALEREFTIESDES